MNWFDLTWYILLLNEKKKTILFKRDASVLLFSANTAYDRYKLLIKKTFESKPEVGSIIAHRLLQNIWEQYPKLEIGSREQLTITDTNACWDCVR